MSSAAGLLFGVSLWWNREAKSASVPSSNVTFTVRSTSNCGCGIAWMGSSRG